jgi:NAD(P)H-quinone oxidoreductase subunit 4
VEHEVLVDAEPREVFIIASLLVPVIGIGLYPKIVSGMYDATTQQITAKLRQSVPTLVESSQVASSTSSVPAWQAPAIARD